jgi:hypothetical protein
MLYGWGHKCCYDFETVDWILKGIGFRNIRRMLYQDSSLPEIGIMEPYTPSGAWRACAWSA